MKRGQKTGQEALKLSFILHSNPLFYTLLKLNPSPNPFNPQRQGKRRKKEPIKG